MPEQHAERHEQTATNTAELDAVAAERRAELKATPESSIERPEDRAEAAREIIHKQERQPEPTPAAETEQPPAPAAQPFAVLRTNYAHTMASLQRQLKPVSRQFSRFIHTPAVEKTSEVVGATVARPSVTVGATWTALIIGSLFYLIARRYGFALSGSELIFSFIIGAALGLVVEGLWRAAKRR